MNSAADPTEEPKKSGCAKRLFYAFLCAVLMLVGAYVFVDWSGKKRWEETRARLEKEGLPMERREPERPYVPPEENFGDSPLMRAATGLDGEEGKRRIKPYLNLGTLISRKPTSARGLNAVYWLRTEMAKKGDWAIPPVENEPDDSMALLTALKELDQQLEELHLHAMRPHAILPSQFSPLWEIPTVTNCLRLGRVLNLLGYCHIQSGNTRRAVEIIAIKIRMAELVGESNTTALLLQKGLHNFALDLTTTGLDKHAWNSSELTQLLKLLKKQPRSNCLDAVRSEWVYMREQFDLLASSQRESSTMWRWNSVRTYGRYLPVGFIRHSQSDAADLMHSFIRTLEIAGREAALAEADRISNSERAKSTLPWVRLPCETTATNATTLNVVLFREFQHKSSRIQLALEQRFLQHGAYPSTLAELVPNGLEAIPEDLDGSPLRYRLETADRYIIWSVGTNKLDDWGGVWSNIPSDQLHDTYHSEDWLAPLPSLKSRFE